MQYVSRLFRVVSGPEGIFVTVLFMNLMMGYWLLTLTNSINRLATDLELSQQLVTPETFEAHMKLVHNGIAAVRSGVYHKPQVLRSPWLNSDSEPGFLETPRLHNEPAKAWVARHMETVRGARK